MESLSNNFFKSIYRSLDYNIKSSSEVTTRYHHPKLAIVTRLEIRVIDTVTEDIEDVIHKIDIPVHHVHLYKHYLWVVLEDSQLKIINLYNAAVITVHFQNVGFKVKMLQRKNDEIVFISESGDCFTTSDSMIQMIEKSKPTEEVSLDAKFVKARCDITTLSTDEPQVGGTTLKLTKNNDKELVAECLSTGLQVIMNFDCEIGGFATFQDSDHLIIQLKVEDSWQLTLMRILNHQWETSIETPGIPVGGNGDTFFYISTSDGHLFVNSVKRHEPLQVARALASCGKYDEAHDYALKNHLDVEPLLKMKLTGFLDRIFNGENVENSELSDIFEQIGDLDFLVEQASQLCQHQIFYKPIVLSLQTRYAKKSEYSEKLQLILARVGILEFLELRGGCEYISSTDMFQSDLDEICIRFITNGDVDVAAVVWSKRCSIIQDVSSELASSILNATPQLIKLNALMVWLRTLFPSIINEKPFFVDMIVKWAVDRIFSLEKSKYWPDIGLKFTADIVKVLEESMFAPVKIQPHSLDTLHRLTLHMNTIKHLKEKYRVNMLVKELTLESPADVVKTILHRCYTEDLKVLMEEYLPNYVSRHGLEYDKLLQEYVERLMEASAIDDARLPVVVQAMYSNENRISCVLHVVENIDVPWSDNIYQLAVETSAFDHESSERIKIQLKHAKLKMVLKKYNFPFTYTDYEYVLMKIVSTTPVVVEDMKTVVAVAGRLNDFANLLYINKCLHTSGVKPALQYCNGIETPEKKTLARSVMIYLESLLISELNNPAIERNYLDFLKGMNFINSSQIKNTVKMYNLKNCYGIRITTNNYCIQAKRMDVFIKWCQIHGSELATKIYYMKALNLAALLLIEAKIATPVILEHMKDKFHQSTLEGILQNSNELILKKIIEEFDLSLFYDGKQPDLLMSFINMFTEFAASCNEEFLGAALEVLSILLSVKNCNYFVNNSSMSWKFHYIFMPVSTYSSMNDFIGFYNKLRSADFSKITTSSMSRNDLIPLRMLSEISNCNAGMLQSLPSELKEIKEMLAKRMLTKILLSQHCDELLVTSLLFMIPSPDDWLRDLYDSQSTDHTNSSLVSYMMLAEKLFGFRDLVPRSATGYQQVLKSRHNLDITDFTYSEDIYETTNLKFVLFNILKANPNMGIDCLQDVCKTFNVSVNDALTLQVIALISLWDLKYEIYKDSLDCKQIDVKNDEKHLYSKCSVILESIKSKEFLLECLKEFWNNGEISLGGQTIGVNPYHYEVFLCIYHLVSKVSSDWKTFREFLLLQFLMQYRRVTSPRQTEMDVYSVKGSFPEIGYYRLPFHMFNKEDMWANLKYEITLQSYTRWLPIIMLLRLDKDGQIARDMLCSTAVKQTMTQQKVTNENNLEQYKLFVTNESLLKQAHECVQHISNMEWAAACLFFVLQGTKRGADQLSAAELTYQFAQQWSKLQPNNNVVKKMQYKYCTLSTMHILHKMGYKDQRLHQLCTDPGALIKTLYGEKSYIDNMLEYNVNKFIDEIADKNGVNINSIRYQILENILDQKNKRASDASLVGLEGNELTRARYILKATCPNIGAIYLVHIGLDSDSDFNKAKKLRAIQCLMSIVDCETLFKTSNMDRSALQTTLLDLYFSIELEQIDMPFLVATFIEDKSRALKQIWQSCEKTADTLRVVAQMGTIYPLSDDIIQELLPAMIRLDLVEEMRFLLPHLKCTHLPIYSTAWSKVLLTPFEKADHPVGERQRKHCLATINMLPKCPVIKDADLQNIWSNCVRCKCTELGCLVLPYMSPNQRAEIADWNKIDRRYLIANIKNLHAETFLVIAALSIVESLTARTL